MISKIDAPYGSWASPISTEMIVGGSIGLGQIALDGDDIYWTESRPTEKGRTALVRRRRDGTVADALPGNVNINSRVHEYGGGAFTVAGENVYFVNFADTRIYCQKAGAAPVAITADDGRRYADIAFATDRLIAVCEEHNADYDEPKNYLAAIRDDGSLQILAEGEDFYAAPRLSPDGKQLAWLSWTHPNMPWDGCRLNLAEIATDGTLSNRRIIAGGNDEAVFQPSWSPDGRLVFVSDRSGWWNLYAYSEGAIEALCPMAAEFGLPQWVFGMSTYGHLEDGRILSTYCEGGEWRLGIIEPGSGKIKKLDLPFCSFDGVKTHGNRGVFVAGSKDSPSALVLLDCDRLDYHVIRSSLDVALDAGYVSAAKAVSFPTAGGHMAHGYFYAPQNAGYQCSGELPPLIVKSHGGPTGQTSAAFSLKIQYWTSRGFAVLDVNYRGSTGYGRAFRRLLNGAWGIADVEDCVAGAEFCVREGWADNGRLIITGGSAGGYTTLCALTFADTFHAGASHYGIGDLSALAEDTHKFESRYLDGLIGPWPEAEAVYKERSPIEHAGRLNCPVIFFQGLDDKVVPPNQAEAMVSVLRDKGIPVAYVPFEKEAHGFRQAANITAALEGELQFYARIFGFTPADEIDDIEIANL